MSYPHLIGLCGKARSGKSTVARHLCERYGYSEFKFAGLLKEYAQKYFGLTPDECEHKTPESRRILQGIGEMIRCEIDKNYWIDKLAGQVRFGLNVISDVRYLNELEWIHQVGGVLWRLYRLGENGHTIEYGADHASETEMDQWCAWNSIIRPARIGVAHLLVEIDWLMEQHQ